MGGSAPRQLPPAEMMARVGHAGDPNSEFSYQWVGEFLKSKVVDLLGPEWTWEGRRMLDFGCGPGRLLRQFLDEARVAEFYGSDIDDEMVGWARAHLCPPIADARVNGERPPLDYPDGQFDLVTALSVFTHIADGWSDWLLEIRRVLKPDGLFIATFLDASVARTLTAVPWDEERVGMSACGFTDPETLPNVLHSQWWLREHWGRAFEIIELRPGEEFPTHAWALLRACDGELKPEQLEREDPDDRRYHAARRYQLELFRAEGEEIKRRHEEIVQSASWKLTAPFRRAKARVSRARQRARQDSNL
jgi:SAM-dependent methyltransferase